MSLADIAEMVAETLVDEAGSIWTYRRGQLTDEISMYKADIPPQFIDNGNGQSVEIIMVSFRCKTSAVAAFGKPNQGDKITDGASTFEVQPVIDKCYYTVGGMIHIHAKQVAG